MRPYSCLMYVGLCIRIPLLCICVYTVNICDSMRPDPCYVWTYASVFLCIVYLIPLYVYGILCVGSRIPLSVFLSFVGLSIPLLHLVTFNICDSMRPDPCYVCGPMRPYSCLMYVGLCIRVSPCYAFVSIRLIYVILCVGSLLCMWTYASVFLSYVCGSMHPYPLLCICVYTVNICDSMRPDPVVYVDLCVRILVLCMWVYASVSPCYAFVSIRLIYVILCVRIPVMYVDLCVRILVLCMWVYASVSPCYAFVSIRLIYVILCVRIPVMYVDLCVRILVLCMWVYASMYPLVMHLCLYG
ncbi:unnamed protein product [Acanthosepion pharaonis]|uniref:Uncharacterized protein n=1 Tax=Acanthosepion pharaonis TaxID=158019 RepID=A0A812BGB6_ACAPH|nr:unnamed protein product [Sepia pharaonis]